MIIQMIKKINNELIWLTGTLSLGLGDSLMKVLLNYVVLYLGINNQLFIYLFAVHN